jgi:transcriptional regulator with XRE-family HTH domain
MTADDIKALRKELGITQRALAEALKIEVAEVRAWEASEGFATKAHCGAMERLRTNPPPKPAKSASPMQLLADPKFMLLVRKLMAHPKLRAEVERLAAEHPDPLDA